MTIGTGHLFFSTVDAYFSQNACCVRREWQATGMPRPHPSLERLEMDLLGSLRPIRVDHTKFFKWQLNNNTNSSKSWRLDILCEVLSSSFLNPFEFRKPKTGCQASSKSFETWKWLVKKTRRHPSFEGLENDLKQKSDLIQVLRDLKWLIQVFWDLKWLIQVLRTWKWLKTKIRPHPSLERLEKTHPSLERLENDLKTKIRPHPSLERLKKTHPSLGRLEKDSSNLHTYHS
jgi:hypothetical protein